jgi:hypothetical protein
MTTRYDPAIVDEFLSHYWAFHPVDATFMGSKDYDDVLPLAAPQTLSRELEGIAALQAKLEKTEIPQDLGNRLDRRMMLAELAVQQANAVSRPRLHNPAWYSGEAAFSIISLLLPQSAPIRHQGLIARLNAIQQFLTDAAERLDGVAVPKGWCQRAQRESVAMAGFLRSDIKLHEEFADEWAEPARRAADVFEKFASMLDFLTDKNPACGEEHLSLIMSSTHGLTMSPRGDRSGSGGL